MGEVARYPGVLARVLGTLGVREARPSGGGAASGCREFSAAEVELWEAFSGAGTVDLRAGGGAHDDSAQGGGWGPERSIRAEFIA
jgi:hypothetical protein